MSLQLFEGFDHYTDSTHALEKGWTNAGGYTWGQTGRWPAQGSAVSKACYSGAGIGNMYKTLSAPYGTVYAGIAFKPGVLGDSAGLYLADSVAAVIQISMFITAGGAISVYRNGDSIGNSHNGNHGVLLGSSATGLIIAGTWYYIELGVVFSTSATGSVIVRINGSSTAVINLSSVQTAASANAQADTIVAGAANATNNFYDDAYFCDSGGSSPYNTFLGDVKTVTVQPVSPAGRLTQWSQVGGTSGQPWTAVNETNPDDDTSYVYDSTVGDIEDFSMASAGTIATLLGVQMNAFARKDDAGSRSLGLGVGNGTTENFDAGHSLGSSYVCYQRLMQSNPITSAAWSPSDLPTLQGSLKVIT